MKTYKRAANAVPIHLAWKYHSTVHPQYSAAALSKFLRGLGQVSGHIPRLLQSKIASLMAQSSPLVSKEQDGAAKAKPVRKNYGSGRTPVEFRVRLPTLSDTHRSVRSKQGFSSTKGRRRTGKSCCAPWRSPRRQRPTCKRNTGP